MGANGCRRATQEFATLVVPADAAPSSASHGRRVYCAFDGQKLLGVFSNEDAAKWCASRAKSGRVEAQLVDQSRHPQDGMLMVMDQSPHPRDEMQKMPPAHLTAPGEPSKTAAAVPVPASGPSTRSRGKDVV